MNEQAAKHRALRREYRKLGLSWEAIRQLLGPKPGSKPVEAKCYTARPR